MVDALQSLFRGMRISATGMAAERVRFDTISENIANARNTRTVEGGPYRRKLVVFEPLLERARDGRQEVHGVRAARIVPDLESPMEMLHDPGHPDANAQGFVEMPNVNTTREMADLITAMRAYESNLAVEEAFRRMAQRSLELAR